MAAAKSSSGGLCGSPLAKEQQPGPRKVQGSKGPAPTACAPACCPPPGAARNGPPPRAPPAAGAGETVGEQRPKQLLSALQPAREREGEIEDKIDQARDSRGGGGTMWRLICHASVRSKPPVRTLEWKHYCNINPPT
ncbi:hypothetical protein GQ55_2G107000 [Panicum hallii var. hallii]|uniref:Uncharacterized protein n=1 Tax=Panicum hallii var. hallii TaxID=1504633 RepID=A0A2T7ENL5_9POAL|nr:hypothetical protein GQ55_2G107000 [Panicum hallii var. hallii]